MVLLSLVKKKISGLLWEHTHTHTHTHQHTLANKTTSTEIKAGLISISVKTLTTVNRVQPTCSGVSVADVGAYRMWKIDPWKERGKKRKGANVMS